MTDEEEPQAQDLAGLLILLTLALLGLIPWTPVLFGEKPAYSAELGAAVTLMSTTLLLAELWEIRPRRRRRAPHRHREVD